MTLYGVHLGPEPVEAETLSMMWRRIDDLGFDWISVWDHIRPRLTALEGSYDAVVSHTALALATRRATCGVLVYSITHRHPVVLANAIATIDRFSGGRAALGIGAGWSAAEHRAYGIGFPPLGERFDRLEEWLPCLRQLLDGDSVTYEGRFAQLVDARLVPGAVQEHLPIWVGGAGERRTLRIAARFADGWNSPAGLGAAEYARKVDVLSRHCEDVGRDPSSIRKAANLLLAWDEAHLRELGGGLEPKRDGALLGGPDEVADQIAAYVNAGADQVNFSYLPQWGIEGIERVHQILALG